MPPRRPEPIEQALQAVDPVEALLSRLRDKVMPLIEQQRDPVQRSALLAALEEDLRDAFKVLGELESELREIRERCAGLWKTARKLRTKSKPRRGMARSSRPARRPSQPPSEEEKQAVREALQKRRAAAMGELCHLTGLIMFRVKRVLQAFEMEGKVKRFGERSGTRYRWTGDG